MPSGPNLSSASQHARHQEGLEWHLSIARHEQQQNSGPANVLWPASNGWPGSEIDIGEIDSKGGVYMATHWRNAEGNDAHRLFYTSPGFNQWEFHTYAALLQTDKITYLIDDVVIGVDTDHPAPDAARGGENNCIRIMNRSGPTGIESEWVRWTPESIVR